MSLAELIWGSVVNRPYVYAFFACFVVFAVRQLGWRRMVLFAVPTYLLAFGAEYSSTRNGFPFGHYRYYDDTRGSELWISNVPLFDSLSFVFLSYFSFVIARQVLSPTGKRDAGMFAENAARATPWVGGLLMMMLDVVIDPVALQGDKWFLGKIYDYPYRGFYFGVTAANFAGWFIVGLATQWVFQGLLRVFSWSRAPLRRPSPLFSWAAFAVYAGVFLFNLGITMMIGDYRLALASAVVATATLLPVAVRLGRQRQAGAS